MTCAVSMCVCDVWYLAFGERDAERVVAVDADAFAKRHQLADVGISIRAHGPARIAMRKLKVILPTIVDSTHAQQINQVCDFLVLETNSVIRAHR